MQPQLDLTKVSSLRPACCFEFTVTQYSDSLPLVYLPSWFDKSHTMIIKSRMGNVFPVKPILHFDRYKINSNDNGVTKYSRNTEIQFTIIQIYV